MYSLVRNQTFSTVFLGTNYLFIIRKVYEDRKFDSVVPKRTPLSQNFHSPKRRILNLRYENPKDTK